MLIIATADQDSTPPKLSPSVVSRKDVANADQTNVSQAGLREPATSDVTRPSEKTQEFSPDAYLTKSEKPLLPMEGKTVMPYIYQYTAFCFSPQSCS